MEEQISHQLKIKRVQNMKNPVLFINKTNYDELIRELEITSNVKLSDVTHYKGVKIEVHPYLDYGKMFVIDANFNLKQ